MADAPTTTKKKSSLPDTCDVKGCDSARYSRLLCVAHYGKWRRHGDPLGGRPAKVKAEPAADKS